MSQRPRGIIVAIDGPAASGKSTTAAAVADILDYCHLNSGQLYRAITWAALDGGWVDAPPDVFAARVAELDLRLVPISPAYQVLVDGRDPGSALWVRETSGRVSEVAAVGVVRRRVLDLLRAEGVDGAIVCDGRDIGTVVFPNAESKVFLLASATERGRRRLLDHGVAPTPDLIREEARLLESRDEADSTRELSPLVRADDAVEIDTTSLEFPQVVDRIVELARAAGAVPRTEVDGLFDEA